MYSLTVNILRHTATHCNTLQHTAIHCNTLLQERLDSPSRVYIYNALIARKYDTTHCNTLQHAATHCSTLLRERLDSPSRVCTHIYTATHCNTLQHTASNTLQRTATHCTALQHTVARETGLSLAHASESLVSHVDTVARETRAMMVGLRLVGSIKWKFSCAGKKKITELFCKRDSLRARESLVSRELTLLQERQERLWGSYG